MKRKKITAVGNLNSKEKRSNKVKIFRLLIFSSFLILFIVTVYIIFLINSFNFTFSDKYKGNFESLKEQTWLFVRVNNPNLEVALIEEMQLIFVSDNFQNIYEVSINKDTLLEDRTEYNRRGVIKVSDILIRSSTIKDLDNHIDALKWYVEELISYRIDQVVIVPPIVYSQKKITLDDLNSTIMNWKWKNIITEGKAIREAMSLIYSSSSKNQLINFRNKYEEYNFYEKKIIPQESGEDIEAGLVFKYISVDQWSDLLQSLEIYENLLLEQAQIEIYNATDITGMSIRLGRWLENLGLLVVRTENAPLLVSENCSGNMIYVVDKTKYNDSVKEVVAIIKERFGNEVNLVYNRPEFVATGDIIVVLCK